MEQSENINELAAALAKAQGEMKNAGKEKTAGAGGKFSYKYADLTECLNVAKEALSAQNISFIQLVGPVVENKIEVTTQMMHSSGQWVRSSMTMPVAKMDCQQVGSAVTYARRYALCAMVGLGQDDDDGAKAMGEAWNQQNKPFPPKAAQAPAPLQAAQAQLGGQVVAVDDSTVRVNNGVMEVRGSAGWSNVEILDTAVLTSLLKNGRYAQAHGKINEILAARSF